MVGISLNPVQSHNSPTIDLNVALLQASVDGRIKNVKALLHEGSDPNTADAKGKTALHLAADKGHEEIVKRLLDCEQTNPTAVDQEGILALYVAARHNHVQVFKVLVEDPHITADMRSDIFIKFPKMKEAIITSFFTAVLDFEGNSLERLAAVAVIKSGVEFEQNTNLPQALKERIRRIQSFLANNSL